MKMKKMVLVLDRNIFRKYFLQISYSMSTRLPILNTFILLLHRFRRIGDCIFRIVKSYCDFSTLRQLVKLLIGRKRISIVWAEAMSLSCSQYTSLPLQAWTKRKFSPNLVVIRVCFFPNTRWLCREPWSMLHSWILKTWRFCKPLSFILYVYSAWNIFHSINHFLKVAIRHNDGAAVWTMTGLAIRIAHGMGMDRDGELFKLRPLEVELRRRVWHQISLLDLRASEARGTFPTHLSYDTKLPLSINDSDIGPETKTLPEPRFGLTDMTASLLRLEFCEVTRRLHKTSSLAAKEKMIEEFRQNIETKFIRYFLEGGPFELWCTRLSRLIMNRMILMLFKREKNLPPATREHLFFTSIEIIDLANQLRSDEYAKKWDWLIRTYVSLVPKKNFPLALFMLVIKLASRYL